MSSTKRDILNQTINFIELLVDPVVQSSTTPEQAGSAISAFRTSLRDFNEDVTNAETRPFMLIHAKADEVLVENVVNNILIEADKQGLSHEFKKVEVNGYAMGFFSHRARPFVDNFIQGKDIAYMNMLSNGIVFDDIQCVGFYTATEGRLQASLIEMRAYVQLR